MNNSSGSFRKKGRGGKGRKRRSKTSSHQRWVRELESRFEAYRDKSSKGNESLIVVYRDGPSPPRIPTPQGPMPDATLTTIQCVRGSDMTLPTGSALVGALLRQGGSTDVFAAYAFCLADVPNNASFAALFDQYRIDEVHFRVKAKNNNVFLAGTASPNNASPSPLFIIDLDDNTAPTTLLEMQQYDNCQQISAQDNLDIVLRPSITPSVFAGGVFSGYGVEQEGMWLDMANVSIPHYGIKVGFPALVTSTTYKWDWEVVAWYKVSFRKVR